MKINLSLNVLNNYVHATATLKKEKPKLVIKNSYLKFCMIINDINAEIMNKTINNFLVF